jgi:lactoylglutathione lyase
MLGLHKHGEFRSEKENVDEDILTLGRGLATVEIDIMSPIDVHKSPKVLCVLVCAREG